MTEGFRTGWTVGRLTADTSVWIAAITADAAADDVAATHRLLEYRKQWRVELGKTDTVDTERTEWQPDSVAVERLLETAGIIEVFGPAVPGHSRLAHSVVASDKDQEELDRVFAARFPNGNRHGESRTDRHNLRDAMHVATSIRYGWNGLVTVDDAVLSGARRVRAAWQFEVLRPTEAVQWVERRIALEDRWAQVRTARQP